MPRAINYDDYEDDDREYQRFLRRKAAPAAKPKAPREPANLPAAPVVEAFEPTFTASRHEKRWIQEYLGGFHDDHLITDVLSQVKGGKEATVYCCRAHASTGRRLLAAKVYRPREFRAIRNDSLYREGRTAKDEAGKEVRDRRGKAAIAGRTKVGRAILHASWLGHEHEVMSKLHAAGADVPQPFAKAENAILMTYVGDEDAAAPTLSQVALPSREARPLFERIIGSVRLMLANGVIHGDLSAYNVLYFGGAPTIIDFPQAVDPFNNPSAFSLFRRDVDRLCAYFAKQGVRVEPDRLARQIWADEVHPQHDGHWTESLQEWES